MGPDCFDRGFVEARDNELLDPTRALVDHAQCRVGGAGQLCRSLDDPLEDGVDRELRRHRDPGVEEGSQATILGLLHAGMVSRRAGGRPTSPRRYRRILANAR